VYLEKPFTITAPEAQTLLQLGENCGVKVTAGHNLQFTLEMLEMRKLVKSGFLGGAPVHLESHFSYDLGDTSYVGPLLADRNHWVRRLPGQLLHNILSHGIAKLVEFLDGENIEIVARAHQSEKLRRMGGQEVVDELRVLMRDRRGTTAFFCFSTQLKPGMNQLRVCGPANSLTVDHANGTLIRHRSRSCKSYLSYFLPPLINALEHFKGARVNVLNFLRKRLHQDFGMKELIEQLYQSIRTDGPPPIPYREIILTARIMDEIFVQAREAARPDKAEVEFASVT
jgi:predicted dehydrogenase